MLFSGFLGLLQPLQVSELFQLLLLFLLVTTVVQKTGRVRVFHLLLKLSIPEIFIKFNQFESSKCFHSVLTLVWLILIHDIFFQFNMVTMLCVFNLLLKSCLGFHKTFYVWPICELHPPTPPLLFSTYMSYVL